MLLQVPPRHRDADCLQCFQASPWNVHFVTASHREKERNIVHVILDGYLVYTFGGSKSWRSTTYSFQAWLIWNLACTLTSRGPRQPVCCTIMYALLSSVSGSAPWRAQLGRVRWRPTEFKMTVLCGFPANVQLSSGSPQALRGGVGRESNKHRLKATYSRLRARVLH